MNHSSAHPNCPFKLQAKTWATDSKGITAMPASFIGPLYGGGFSLSHYPQSHMLMHKMRMDESYSPSSSSLPAAITTHVTSRQCVFFSQCYVHAGEGYDKPNIRLHAYADIPGIKREDDATRSPFHEFGERGRIFGRATVADTAGGTGSDGAEIQVVATSNCSETNTASNVTANSGSAAELEGGVTRKRKR